MFTIYDMDNEQYSKVEEPDSSFNYTYADYLQWKFEERDESKIDTKGCCGAPDLVVEILSPGNSHKEVKLKFELDAGKDKIHSEAIPGLIVHAKEIFTK